MEDFPLEIQEAFVIHAMLPIDGTELAVHIWAKTGLQLNDLLNIQEVHDKKTTCYFLKHIESCHTININGELKRKQDAEKRQE